MAGNWKARLRTGLLFRARHTAQVLLATRARFQDKMTELQSSLALTQGESPTRGKVPDPEEEPAAWMASCGAGKSRNPLGGL